MIRIRGLEKRFGRSPALSGVALDVAPGRVTALVGPNASGKTTLMKCILGLVRPDSGVMELGGERIGVGSEYRERIGYMPQMPSFPGNLSGAELLRMLRDLRGPDAAVDESLIAQFELDLTLRKPLRTLSGGTRQKVSAVVAFLFRPSLLLLDEPTAGMDPMASGVLKDRVRRERERGTTFILSTHVMSEVEELADDVVFLLDGRVCYAGPTERLKARSGEPTLERALAGVMREARAA